MTTTSKELFVPQLIGTSESVLYSVPVNTVSIISYVSLHNTSTEAVTVTISTPTSGQISNSSNQLSVKRIAGLETLRVYDAVGYTLNAGASIRAVADTDNVVNIRAGGVEIV